MAHSLAVRGSETSFCRTDFQSVLSYKRTLAAVMGALLLLASAPPVVQAQNRLTLQQQQQRQQLLLVQQQLLQAQQQQLLRQLFSNNSTAAQQMQWLNQPANQQQIQQYLQASAAQRRQFFQQQLKQAKAAKQQFVKKKLKKGPIRVLFIGDSLTMANNLPKVVAGMAAAVKVPAMTLDSVLIGGTTLQMFWNQGTALRKIRTGKFDYVVLQEQSMMPIIAPGVFLQYARLFDREIRKAGGTTVFFLTWAHQDLPATQDQLNQAYRTAQRLCPGSLLAPAGLAFQLSAAANPNLNLYADAVHPNGAGTYLASAVIYATLYNQPTVGLPRMVFFGGQPILVVADDVARYLQAIGAKAIAAK